MICPTCNDTFVAHDDGCVATVSCPRCHSTFPPELPVQPSVAVSTLPGRPPQAAAPPVSSEQTPTATAPAPRAAHAPADLPQLPGYEMLRYVARGGMGMVLQARHTALNRSVAIKIPLAEGLLQPGLRERFLREARAAARLRHPNICPIYEVGEFRHHPYIAMAFIEGGTLRDWLNARQPSPREAAAMIARVARAVGYAHEHSIIHRDLKPSNVMLDHETGEPVLMDFGLAKELEDQGAQVTQSGQVMGTPAYMAPEQAAGDTARIGPATDVYALGVMLYETLCGRPPFLGNSGEIIRMVQTDEVVPPRKRRPELHRDIETICLKALARNPQERYPDAEAMADDLTRFCDGEVVLARRAGPLRRVSRKLARNRVTTGVAVAVLVTLLVMVGVWRSASTTHRTTTLTQAVARSVEAGDWSGEHLAELDGLVDELREVAPDLAEAAGERVAGGFSAAIAGWIGRPRLTPADVRQIEASLVELETRSPDHVAVLRRQLGQRLGAWQPLFDLTPPFAGVDATFDAAAVTVEDGMLRRVKPAAETPRDPRDVPRVPIVTAQACDLQVQLEVAFDAAWAASPHVGVVLNAAGSRGYQFQVHVAEPATPAAERTTLGAAIAAGERVRLTISRDGNELAAREVPAEQLGEGVLRLRATRDLDQLMFQVNHLPPLVIQDIFPLSQAEPGRYGILWPLEVPVQRVTAATRVLPSEPSPLEQGDRLYSQGAFDAALAYYRQQAAGAHGLAFEQEARFKEAACLLQLNRRTEAEPILTQLAADPGERFPVLAGSRLWLLHLEDGDWQAADAAFASLSARFTYPQLAAHVPYALRQRIVQITPATAGVNHFRSGSSDDIRMLARVAAMQALLGAETDQRLLIDWHLLRSLHAAGQLAQAQAIARAAVETSGLGAHWNIQEELTWLMRLEGQADQALDLLDEWLELPGLTGHAATRQKELLLDRARTLVALERWDEAEAEVLAYLRQAPEARSYYFHSSAWLMLGLLRDRRGDAEGALQAWQAGTYGEWRSARDAATSHSRDAGGSYSDIQLSGMAYTHLSILGSLTDTLSDEEAEMLVQSVLATAAGDTPVAVLRGPVEVNPAVLRRMWQHPRAKAAAWQIAFREVPFPILIDQMPVVAATEQIRQGAFDRPVTADEDALLWETAEAAAHTYRNRQLSTSQLIQLGMTWKGVSNVLGWAGVAPTLDPQLRARFGYVFGCRYQTLGQHEQATRFFQAAQRDAPDDALVHRLAAERLQARE